MLEPVRKVMMGTIRGEVKCKTRLGRGSDGVIMWAVGEWSQEKV